MSMKRPYLALVPLLVAALLWCNGAQAQVLGQSGGLPNVQVPGVGLPALPPVAPNPRVDALLRKPLAVTRQLQIDTLLREEPRRVALDPQGAPIVRGEFLAIGLSAAQINDLQAVGFISTSDAPTDATLGLDIVILRDTRGRTTAAALQTLEETAPGATFTYQHIYLQAGAGTDGSVATGASPTITPRRVGLIDGGVDAENPALARARIERHGCGKPIASRHGTAVAARLIDGGSDTLYAADLWCGDKVGGATSSLVEALAWMARERVAVINISLVGPDNPVLARAIQVMIARGHVLVSAVGNDGPAAPPLFPAAYPGVIGVSAVDAHDRVLPESGSGQQVAFCASGVVGRGRSALRGTSFAAPIVARKAAQLLDAPRPGAAAYIEQHLASEARDLGQPGRDPRYGYGLLSP
ncbi:MAG TPA: S8 family serine peptidase [Rhodanobacter sp.]